MKTPLLRGVLAAIIGLALCILAVVLIPSVRHALGASFFLSLIVFGFVSAGAWWLLPGFLPGLQSTNKNGPPLSVTEKEEWTVIAARASPLPKRGPILCALIPAVAGIFLINVASFAVGLGVWIVATVVFFALMKHGDRTKRHAMLEPFAVKRDAVRLPDGQLIPRQRIYRFGTRNTQDGQVLFYGGNSAHRLGQVNQAMTHARMVPISYAVVVEHDGTLSYLAGGLTQELANAVLHEIVNHVEGFASR